MHRRSQSERGATPALLLFFALGAYAFVFRAHGLPDDFWLMLDQIRDWDRVQGGLLEIPLHGTERTGGGHHWGPAYYGWLWLVRNTIGRATDNLPHAAGLAGAALDAATSVALSVAVWRAGAPLMATLAATLLWTTLPYEAALARAGWNPAFALALTSIALALTLTWNDRLSPTRISVLTALAVAALHAHTGSVSFLVALCLVLIGLGRNSGQTTRVIASIATTVFVLQIPALIESLRSSAHSPTAIERTLAGLFSDKTPPSLFRGAFFFASEGSKLLFPAAPHSSVPLAGATTLLIMALSARSATRGTRPAVARTGILLSALSIVLSIASYTIVREVPQRYWLLLVLPSAFVLFAFGLGEVQRFGRIGAAFVGVLLITLVLIQPRLWTISSLSHRYPSYGVLVEAASNLRDRDISLRRLVGPVDHAMPTNSTALYRWLGGHVSEASTTIAVVRRDGTTRVAKERTKDSAAQP